MARYYPEANLVRQVRQMAGISQRELAQRLGKRCYQTIQKWENGERRLTPTQLSNIAKALDLSASQINDLQRMLQTFQRRIGV